jgi:hypothetical protein
VEITMTRSVRELILSTASVLALGIGGIAPGSAADAGNAVNAGSAFPACPTPDSLQTAASLPIDPLWAQQQLRRDDIRWAQVELRNRALYEGSLDGILGPETKRALRRFQRKNGLGETASLDAQTWEALTGNTAVGLGTSMPSDAETTTGSMTNSPASNLGR